MRHPLCRTLAFALPNTAAGLRRTQAYPARTPGTPSVMIRLKYALGRERLSASDDTCGYQKNPDCGNGAIKRTVKIAPAARNGPARAGSQTPDPMRVPHRRAAMAGSSVKTMFVSLVSVAQMLHGTAHQNFPLMVQSRRSVTQAIATGSTKPIVE